MSTIKEAREKAGLTQLEVAKKLKISDSFLSQLENGKRKLSLQMAIDIAEVLGMNPTDIFLPCNMSKCKVDKEVRSVS
ncbi:helix-turn-helix transcriptional regulator [Desulfosporosinus sp. OT]|uniref:helix-turn-helix transcriptional regulator n=1 Tax=Desulfosporosinus sp. OT TaxID=913865 RepID=UPI0002239CF0|nr:helix-turn-helix transcriptional regulator [Desulfosporosinus sp. OT]EGW39355.1 helix-turn-helix family protein [Desulfosporosinus sp. OT]